MAVVSGGQRGRRQGGGGRRAAGKATVTIPRRAYLLAVAVVACVAAWVALVWLAISFGSSARSGESGAWPFLALAAVGAVACLFLGLMLGARLAQSVGIADSQRSQQPHRH